MNTPIGHAIGFGGVACLFLTIGIAGLVKKKIRFGAPVRGAEISRKEEPTKYWLVEALVFVAALLPALVSVSLWLQIARTK